MGHKAEDREDDEAGKDTGAAVHQGNDDGISASATARQHHRVTVTNLLHAVLHKSYAQTRTCLGVSTHSKGEERKKEKKKI